MIISKKTVKKTGVKSKNAQKNLTDQLTKAGRNFEDAALYSQKNIQVIAESSIQAAQSFQDLGNETIAYTKRTMEETIAAARDMATVKSIPELAEKQTAYMRHSTESFMNECNRFNNIITEFMKRASSPLSDHISTVTAPMKPYTLQKPS